MKRRDLAELAAHNLRERKLRSWLAILGIIIGVASIVTLLSLAVGLNDQISSRLNSLEANVIQLTPGRATAGRVGGFGGGGFAGGQPGGAGGGFGGQNVGRAAGEFTWHDADDMYGVPGVAFVDGRVQGRLTVQTRGKNASVTVVGTDPASFRQAAADKLLYGRLLSSNDVYSVILGYNVYANVFADQDLLNRQITIAGKAFRVVGLLNQTSASTVVSDGNVYIPQATAKLLLNKTAGPDSVILFDHEGFDTNETATAALAQLAHARNQNPADVQFSATTAASIQQTISGITDALSLFLGGIAAISLIVGAIGVANTMFMSVLERTKEIGILKALGLKDGEVTELFLYEAGAIGIVGGVMGGALSLAVGGLLSVFGVPVRVTLELLLLGLIFSFIVGVLAGVFPARNAAKLQPVEALRYE